MRTSSDDSMSPALLEVDSLSAGYGRVPVVSDIDLSVAPGEVIAIVGPNGAGKSTLLKALTGILPVMSGRVWLRQKDVTGQGTDVLAREGLGYVPQVSDVFETLTVRENLEMGGYLLPRNATADRVEDVLTTFPALRAMLDRTASKLSGGERKMLALGRVLMPRPAVLVLDEPTAGLSAQISRTVLRDHVRRLADETNIGVLLVEQKALEALHVSDRAHVLVSGTIRLTGPAEEVLAREDIRRVFLGEEAADDKGRVGSDVKGRRKHRSG